MTTENENRAIVQTDISQHIIEDCLKGNRMAQYHLYQLYSKAMYNICYRLLNNREDAHDMLQDAFTEAFHKLDSFRFESTFGAWLKRITVNRCINFLNKRKVEIDYLDTLPEPAFSSDNEDELPGLSVEKVKNAMELLPEGGRIIFSLYLLEGYDHSEIAEILNITESTSKTQYMRAKNRIREILSSENLMYQE